MKRAHATALLEELLHQAMATDWPASLVEQVHVFGSYARGAVEPRDLDVAVDFDRSDER